MEHIFEAFQNSFQPNETVIFIANVKDEKQEEGDLMLTQKRLIFYPAKPKAINSILFIDIDTLDVIENAAKGLTIASGDKIAFYEIEYLKEDLIQNLKQINASINVK